MQARDQALICPGYRTLTHASLLQWDRQSFITTVATGKPSIVPKETDIHHNFIVSDYDANGGELVCVVSDGTNPFLY